MRTRPIVLSKTCPYCGARSKAEAKLPVPANVPAVEFNLDNLGVLIQKQSLSLLLALVELLPYKTFACVKCGNEFRLQNRAAKELVGAMLSSMQPAPASRALGTGPRARKPVKPPPGQPAAKAQDWEVESLDAMLDYPVEGEPKA